MLGAARALMLSGGYRPSSSEGHAAVVRFMEAVSRDGEMLRFTGILDRLRRKRHRVVYEEYDITSGMRQHKPLYGPGASLLKL